MADRITKRQRSKNMSRVKGKDTALELSVRKAFFAEGMRYRIHYKLPGRPDIVFIEKKIAIFVHGCFWHQHNCKKAMLPVTNKKFWKEKLLGNKKRDKANIIKLKSLGWEILVLWECELNNKNWFSKEIKRVIDFINSA